jgi:hypothetical protein
MVEKDNIRRSPSSPKILSQILEPITKPAFKAHGLAGNRIISEWPQIIGEKLSSYCIPEKLSFPAGKKTDGTLSIAVENGFAPEIQHMQALILERLAVYFGYKAITRITISHSYTPLKEEKGHSKNLKVALKPFLINEEIDDVELRSALSNIAKSLSMHP